MLLLLSQITWDEVSPRLLELGFETGWGKDVQTIREQFKLLLDIMQVREALPVAI